LDEKQYENLMQQAAKVSENAYAPYSKFPVGAALLTKSGNIYVGTNVENAAYGGTICAERAAIVTAISAGESQFRAIAVYSPKGSITPCGTCRQFISEFGTDIIVLFVIDGVRRCEPIGRLLPSNFDKGFF